jgi:hypothetical protein
MLPFGALKARIPHLPRLISEVEDKRVNNLSLQNCRLEVAKAWTAKYREKVA